MSRDATLGLMVGLVLAAVLLAAGAGAFATSQTTTSTASSIQQIPEPVVDSSAGLIFELRQRGGLNILGIRLRADTYEAHVGLVVPPECVGQDGEGRQQLIAEGECSNLPAHGEVTGNGTTATGVAFVIVRVEVSKGCYAALAIGDTWPRPGSDCES